jgi:tetratricopeptide (TPR) repeat protein
MPQLGKAIERSARTYLRFFIAKIGEWPRVSKAIRTLSAHAGDRAAWKASFGYALLALKDWPAAIAAFREAIALDDRHADWHHCLGRAYAGLLDYGSAARAYEAAIARDDTKPLWRFQLGQARLSMRDFVGAEAAYEAALSCDDTRGDWHGRLGFVRSRLKGWVAATSAYKAALQREPKNDVYRYALARCLAEDGKLSDATAIMAPVYAANDEPLKRFLCSRYSEGLEFETNTLLVEGRSIRSARKITVQHKDRPETYFEQTLNNIRQSVRRRDFYAALEEQFGEAIPDFIPALHHCEIGDKFAYFLFDCVDALPWTPRLREEHGHAIVENIAEINLQLSGLNGDFGYSRLGLLMGQSDASTYLIQAAEKCGYSDDYAGALVSLSDQWHRHQSRYKALPQTLVHGDLNRSNVLLTEKSEIKVIDWATYGLGPVGLDLVGWFSNEIDSDDFEVLADRYFDKLPNKFSQAGRRYTIALLAVTRAITRGTRPPEKWVHKLLHA